MDLEAVLDKFVGISPKLYGVKTIDGSEYTKVKGFKEKVEINQLESLLDFNKNPNLDLSHEKWMRNISQANILTGKTGYRLEASSNKRNIVTKDGIFILTDNITFDGK